MHGAYNINKLSKVQSSIAVRPITIYRTLQRHRSSSVNKDVELHNYARSGKLSVI